MYKAKQTVVARLLTFFLLLLMQCPLLGIMSKALAINIPREHIFVFERNTNTNYVCYDINLKDGKLNQKEPLKTYWVLGHETRIEGLTFLDRKMAFGVKVVKATDDEAVVHLTAYKGLNIRLCKRGGKWVGIVKIGGHEIILQKMFAQMKPPVNARCEYVEVIGTDLKTGEKRTERINP
ncbi:MAG: DUF4833 domain-containing protein [Bacteroidaceae bacterium]|nr:DUF4833 domain-containing protein [Bacteroidaceae bacterium]